MLIQMSVHCFNRENLKESLILQVFFFWFPAILPSTHIYIYTYIYIYRLYIYYIYICTYIYGKMGLAKYCATKSEQYIVLFLGGSRLSWSLQWLRWRYNFYILGLPYHLPDPVLHLQAKQPPASRASRSGFLELSIIQFAVWKVEHSWKMLFSHNIKNGIFP